MVAVFSAPFTPVEGVLPALRERGYAVLTPASVADLCGEPLSAFDTLTPSWKDLTWDAAGMATAAVVLRRTER